MLWEPQGAEDAGNGMDARSAAFEAFEIPLNQSVTVGAFVLDLGTARATPTEGLFEFSEISIDFVAHNASSRLSLPLGGLDEEGLLLEAGGMYFYGHVTAAAVPGLRSGTGTIRWSFASHLFYEGLLSESALRTATISFGNAVQNRVFVSLADPSATVAQADIPLSDRLFSIEGYRDTTLAVTNMFVQYNARSDNEPLPIGTAQLVLEGVLSADVGISKNGEYWGKTNMFLERPDGISVAPDYLSEAIYPGDRENVYLVFELTTPVQGTYTLGVTYRGMPTVTREIMIH